MLANAYLYTGDGKYKKWVKGYVEAWIDRTQKNNGIMPDNIGLSGKIGEYIDGEWYGGYYGVERVKRVIDMSDFFGCKHVRVLGDGFNDKNRDII